MALATPYSQARLDSTWDAIVIGSGFGGLTAARMLAAHGGKRVLVLESHTTAGGFTHTFSRRGYTWDVGVHYIGEVLRKSEFVRRVFDHVSEGRILWQPLPDPFEQFQFPGLTIALSAGEERWRESFRQSFPGETVAIDRYLAAVHACQRVSSLYFAEKALPAALASCLGAALRWPYLRWARQSTRAVLEGLTGNPELIGALSAQWPDYGLPPGESSFAAHAMIVAHYLNGAAYPVGGAGSLAAALVPQIEARGGMVVTGAEVAQILVAGGRARGVRLADGRELTAPFVISDAGAANTFFRLLPAEQPELVPLRTRLRRLRPATAHLNLFVGLKQSDAELGLTGSNLSLFPSFDHDGNVARFARDLDAPFPQLYISYPSAKDPLFAAAHPGRSTIEVLAMASMAPFERWRQTSLGRRGADYEALKQSLSQRMLEELERQHPGVGRAVEHVEFSTPLTTRHFDHAAEGEIYGLAATPERYGERGLQPRTPIRGLYLTGQDAGSLGVTGAMMGGVLCASVVLGKNLLLAAARPTGSR